MEVAAALQTITDGVRALASVDCSVLSESELDEAVRALQQLSHRLAAQTCRFSHRWDQRGVWQDDGSRSPAARLSRDGHCAVHSARIVLHRGRRLDSLPIVATAFAAGELSTDHVDVLIGAAANRELVFARDEAMLVDQAHTLRFGPWCKAVEYWRHRADAELAREDGQEPPPPVSTLSLTPIGGMVALTGDLDPIGAAVVASTLDRIAGELAAEDAAQGRERTRQQLRAAALVEMARRAMAMPVGAQPARIALQIVCGHDRFAELCELSSGTVIRPGQIVPYLDALDVRTFVFDTADCAVATSRRRTFVGSLRSVIEVRDRHCQHSSGCDEPIDRCDVDHIVPWSQGGTTSQDNGRLLCTYHNRIEPNLARPPTRASTR